MDPLDRGPEEGTFRDTTGTKCGYDWYKMWTRLAVKMREKERKR